VIIARDFSADAINAVLNDPLVRPDVADMSVGPLNISEAVDNTNNVLLMGAHGGMLFFQIFPGLYEVHTQVLRPGRGAWAAEFAKAAARWMYTRTDAFEIMTRIPEDHIGARQLAIRTGMMEEFTRPQLDGCVWRGKKQPCDIYSFRIQDWIKDAAEMEPVGADFHDFLHDQARALNITHILPHADDPQHNRYVGAAYEMIINGQVGKGVCFYNRWAFVSRHPLIRLLKVDPIMIEFDIGVIVLEGGTIRVERMDKVAA
jgi:hypothetical protein